MSKDSGKPSWEFLPYPGRNIVRWRGHEEEVDVFPYQNSNGFPLHMRGKDFECRILPYAVSGRVWLKIDE